MQFLRISFRSPITVKRWKSLQRYDLNTQTLGSHAQSRDVKMSHKSFYISCVVVKMNCLTVFFQIFVNFKWINLGTNE